jgi:hypothetical protein
MKTRQGFVSNSSSASFVVSRSALTELQIALIKNHAKAAKILFPTKHHDFDAWEITDNGSEIYGSTIMDNGDMGQFLARIGVVVHIERDG